MIASERSVKILLIVTFMMVSTQCENWGDSNAYIAIALPRCTDKIDLFESKEDLVSALKKQDPLSFRRHKAYEVKALEYELKVDKKQQKRTQEIIEEVETKREIIFK